jgi:hypothetical protein
MKENSLVTFSSVFDKIEEKSTSPLKLIWSNDLDLSQFNTEEFIYEGYLIYMHETKKTQTRRRFVLTKKGFIKYKVINLRLKQ